MSKEDREVIEMANSSWERRKRETLERAEAMRCERNYRKQIRQEKRKYQRKVLVELIPALLLILTALVILAAIVAGSLSQADTAWAAAIAVVLAFGGGLYMAENARR